MRPTPQDGSLSGAPPEHLTIELTGLREIIGRALRMLAETVLVPTLLLLMLLRFVGLVEGLVAVMAWCVLVVGLRVLARRTLPATLLLCTGVLCGRAFVALVMTSAVVYVMQPVLGSLLMAMLFLGSAALGRPITMRLARDFIDLPAQLFHRAGVRRLFTQVALVFGASRLIDVAMSLGFLHWGAQAGLFSRGVGSGLLTMLTVLVCICCGWRQLAGMPGITLHWTWHSTAASVPLRPFSPSLRPPDQRAQ